jgi:hypothetical protein
LKVNPAGGVIETRQGSDFMMSKVVNTILLVVIALAAWFRAVYYGDLRLAIATNDTPSYIDSSKAPLLSWESFSGRRLFATNLVYKLANDAGRCNMPNISQPAAGREGYREIQPCFDKIAMLQNLLSMAGWLLLAWVAARWLENPMLKILSTIVILAFGFTPQIAEWDSVLGAESLSISLFAITLAALLEIVFGLAGTENYRLDAINRFLIAAWIPVFSLWVLVRDVHLYSLHLTILLSIPFLFSRNVRSKNHFIPAILILLLLLLLGNHSARESTRWQTSLNNSLIGYIFPHPARVAYISAMGLPESRSGAAYEAWLEAHGLEAYSRFLLTHPGFIASTLLEHSAYFKSDFYQPYYRIPGEAHREILLVLGEIVHPETNAIYLIDLLILISLCASAVRRRGSRTLARAWLALWLLSYSGLSLVLSFFGDTNGVHRHIYPSVESFRLFLWIFLFQILDTAMENGNETQDSRPRRVMTENMPQPDSNIDSKAVQLDPA